MHTENLPLPLSPSSSNAAKASEKTSRTLTRNDIASAINKRLPTLSRREAKQILDYALQEIADALSQRKECVKLHDFGTFFVRERAERRGRNPYTGENASLGPRKILNFRPSLGLREKVEKGQAQTPTRRS